MDLSPFAAVSYPERVRPRHIVGLVCLAFVLVACDDEAGDARQTTPDAAQPSVDAGPTPAVPDTGGADDGADPGDAAPTPAKVSRQTDLSQATFLTSEVDSFGEIGRHDVYMRLQSATRVCRTWGDGYGYAMVATGRADLMVDPIMAIWDAGPLLPIMQEAGGTFTDWNGKPTIHSGQGIATNGPILDEVLALIAKP